MGRRQTETSYLKSVLLWLQEYWAEPVGEGKVVDSGQRRRGKISGKLVIVWITDRFAGHT